MNKYSLVLAGGGAKGAYQIGAWKALREMGITFDAIAGTSIGSINGALIASGDYKKAVEMWGTISLDKGVKIEEKLPDEENLFSKKNWGVLFKEVLKNGGFDASPTKDFFQSYVDEEKTRQSKIPLYIVTVQMTQGVKPREISLEEIPEGELIDYLLASSNIPLATGIGPEGERFLDGGVYDNVPMGTLKKRGYNKFIVIDISSIKGYAHSVNLTNTQMVYIRPYDPDILGESFNFDYEVNKKRMDLGYLDAKKAFSRLSGRIYYFSPRTFRTMTKKYTPNTVEELEKLAYALNVEVCKVYTEKSFLCAVKKAYSEEIKAQEERKLSQEVQREEEHSEKGFAFFKKKNQEEFSEIEAVEPKEEEMKEDEGILSFLKEKLTQKDKEPEAEISTDPKEESKEDEGLFSFLKEKLAQKDKESEPEIKIESKLEQKSESGFLRNALLKRFSQKNPLDDYPEAVNLLKELK